MGWYHRGMHMEHFEVAGGNGEDRPRETVPTGEVLPELQIVPDIIPEKKPADETIGQIQDIGTFIDEQQEKDRGGEGEGRNEDRPHWKTPDGHTLH